MPGVTTATRVDGRVQRGERTRDAIADALLSLLESGEPQPTARQISAEAGVSLRSVFQHFDDMESVYAMCVARQLERLAPLRAPIAADGDVDTRLEALIRQRSQIYERIAPVRRAAMAVAPTSPVIRDALAEMAGEHRREVATLFSAELGNRERRDRLAALEVATCFDAWDHLRRAQGLSVAAAQRAVRRLARGSIA
jgi:AcrR family transcriptional regulator